jgi:hypothetical protein
MGIVDFPAQPALKAQSIEIKAIRNRTYITLYIASRAAPALAAAPMTRQAD